MPHNSYSLDIWHGCIQSLRKFLRGWNLNKLGVQRKIREGKVARIGEIDIIAEHRLLSNQEWEERVNLDSKLEEMDRGEDLQWKQKVGKNWVLQGDANTHLFHQFMNGRRKKTITILGSALGEIRGQKDITEHIVSYYEDLFGHNEHYAMKLGENFWLDGYKISEGDRARLAATFSLEEVKKATMEMEQNSAPGPNGYSVSFFENYWEVIKGDLMNMF